MTFDPITIAFLCLAVFVIYRLRSVLGQRTGNEPPPGIRRDRPEPADKVVALPGANGAVASVETSADRWKGMAEAGSQLANGLDALVAADRSFDPRTFLAGAKAAYEMIVVAFAKGDRKGLKDLLSAEVFEGFVSVINEREKRGESISTTFVSIDKADFADVQLKGRMAQVTVRFVSKIITATRDRAGVVIDGSPDKVSDVTDVWTFSRDTTARDPNWKLVATEAGQ